MIILVIFCQWTAGLNTNALMLGHNMSVLRILIEKLTMSNTAIQHDSDDELQAIKVLTDYNDFSSWELLISEYWTEHDHLMIEFPCGRVEAIAGDGAFAHKLE